jgi:SulP family sulfate permease
LEGFIFFGAGNLLTLKIHERTQDLSRPPLRFLLLDMRMVSGIDASAAQTMAQLQLRSVRSDCTVIYTHLSPSVASRLSATFEQTYGLKAPIIFEDVDRGLEWCEDQVLRHNGHHLGKEATADLFVCLRGYAEIKDDDRSRLDAFVEVQKVEAGHVFLEHGKRPPGIYFVASGYVSVVLSYENGRTLRLRRGGPGSIYCEMSHFAQATATASLMADVPTTLNLLTHEAVERIERDAPALAAALHKYVAKVLSERLTSVTAQLYDLQA